MTKKAAYEHRLADEQLRKEEVERQLELERQEQIKQEAAAKQRQEEAQKRQRLEAERLKQKQAEIERLRQQKAEEQRRTEKATHQLELERQEELERSQSSSPNVLLNQPPVSRPFTRRQVLQLAIPAGMGIVGVTVASQFLGHQSVDYSRLNTFLKTGKWKEADQETTTLMLKVANREKEGYLDSISLENFSCEVLSKVDRLWVDSSEGKFGFSVQNKIYVESCGGKPDGKFDKKAGCVAKLDPHPVE